MWARVCRVMNREDLIADERFLTNPLRVSHVDAMAAEMEKSLAAKTSREWLNALEAEGVPCGPINNVAQVMSDPQVLARNMIIETIDPDLGPIKMQGNPVKLSAHDDPKTRAAAPDLDADRAEILKELGL